MDSTSWSEHGFGYGFGSGYGRTSPPMGLSMRVLDGTARGLHVGGSAIPAGCEGHCARLKGREGGERA